ncbi:MAG: YebC/PmpR family DNA-binding transcriptional regulator [Planctomycetaceae bacterium]|nr:YebC/PmpR family DNA-binding transcriptional regulator [Planctomycetaceae bacterium]
MAGHSKWANIKHRKAAVDKKRSKIWSNCSRAIIVAARQGGGDPKFNTTLRYAIDDAKAANMPKDTIEKAVKKGSGDLEGESYEPARYEGYGPGGVAIIADCLQSNANKTAPEIRSIFDKGGGNLGSQNSVAFGFTQEGVILLDAEKHSEDDVLESALEVGAKDVVAEEGFVQVTTEPSDFLDVKESLVAAGFEFESAEITFTPGTTVALDVAAARKFLRLIDTLEDQDDVQKVYHNAEIPSEAYD